MIALISFCDIPWWCVFLSWLLPFLLGLLLGWFLWAKFKRMFDSLDSEYREYKLKCSRIEEELKKCNEKSNEYSSDMALLRGRIRECEKELEATIKDSSTAKDALSASSGFAAGKASGKNSFAGIAADKFAALKDDNLQVVEGIGPKMNIFLNKNGIKTWSELAAMDVKDIQSLLDKEGNKYRIINPETWPAQAALARDGKWDELISMQKELDTGKKGDNSQNTDSKIEKLLIKMGVLKKWKKDDLKAIEGVGPKIEGLLHDAGINTWKDLADTSVKKIQKILDKAGKRYALADPGTWPKQAALAASDKWSELEEYQDYLKGGKEK
jgi:predicted flap endonuclease-1-like 5' DNA nuclease